MPVFNALSLCILGRQPTLGLAELESLYGADHMHPAECGALLDVPAEEINFKRLGGVVKVARILAILPNDKWESAYQYLAEKIPPRLQDMPEGKFTLGVSVYGTSLSPKKLNADLLSLKKEVRQKTGRSVRIVPNKSLALNSAQVLHNGLVKKGSWELILVRVEGRFYLAQTLFVQDIEAYAARDQARPARDARVGMLPPKLAQILINLAVGKLEQKPETALQRHRIRLLDPFCGTGVVLQEAMLMGYSVIGTDLEPRMVDYSRRNLRWLVDQNSTLESFADIEVGDATNHRWPGFSVVASEVYLGRPLAKLPETAQLEKIVNDANTIIKKFLSNIASQLEPGQRLCLAVPAWQVGVNKFKHLPVIDQLTDMGYNYLDLKHAAKNDLVYYREDQIVGRQLIILEKK